MTELLISISKPLHYQIANIHILNERNIFKEKCVFYCFSLVKFPRVCVKYALTPPLVF